MALWYIANMNPLHRRTGDCVYRALAVFLDTTWREALDELVGWAADKGLTNFNFRSTYNAFLLEKGYARHRAPRKGMTVREFIDEFAQQGKTYIVSCPRHLTIVKSVSWITVPYLVDTWDCRDRVVDGYWEKDSTDYEIVGFWENRR